MGGGISKFDLRSPAPMPKRKKRMAGSKKLFSKSYSITQLLNYSRPSKQPCLGRLLFEIYEKRKFLKSR
jgi:hypothetical protein